MPERVRIQVKGGPTPDIREFNRDEADKFLKNFPDAKEIGGVDPVGSAAGPDDPSVPFDSGKDAGVMEQARDERAAAEEKAVKAQDKAVKGPKD